MLKAAVYRVNKQPVCKVRSLQHSVDQLALQKMSADLADVSADAVPVLLVILFRCYDS